MTIHPTSSFEFHGRLARFLPRARRGGPAACAVSDAPAVKDRIEALGVPHTEVGRVLIDGVEVPMTRQLHGGEAVAVFPVEVQSAGHPPRFVLDVPLGRLAGYLRLLGVDTLYRNGAGDAELLATSTGQRRVLLSRDTGLLKRAALVDGAFVYATAPLRQLAEVIDRFQLRESLEPYTRCSRCNGGIAPVAAASVLDTVPPRVRDAVSTFSRCGDCGHVYWRGTHEAALRQRLATIGLRI